MQTIEAVVTARRDTAGGVAILELRRPSGEPLPPFEPGAHIDVHLAGGIVRQYSLCNDPGDGMPLAYRLGVKLEEASRGGSRAVHDKLWPGQTVSISGPRNLFSLDAFATRHVLIAGGIGITPILSMLAHSERNGADWSLLYCGRSEKSMAFVDELPASPNVMVHADDSANTLPDLEGLLDGIDPGAHVYCCGPVPLMDAVARLAAGRGIPEARLHFERFSAGPLPQHASSSGAFNVRLARSGVTLPVSPDDTILSVLEAAGFECPSSCQQGICGTCRTGVLEGRPDHRDYILSDAERDACDTIYVCVSRSLSPELVLDL